MSVELTQRIIHVKDNGTYDSLDIFRGAPGEKGDKGDTGQGLIPGGSTGQVLKKRSGTDYDTEWANDASAVTDVQVNGTSILNNGVANVPLGYNGTLGVIKTAAGNGILVSNVGVIYIAKANEGQIKAGNSSYLPIVTNTQDIATFYGLAKAAGADMASSSNAVGTYTDAAKDAIRAMIGVDDGMKIVDVSGATPTITGENNTMYRCGTVTSINITPPQTGVMDVIFTSGSTVAVMTIPNTVEFPEWFDPTDLETNRRYEINIADGWAVVMSWPV